LGGIRLHAVLSRLGWSIRWRGLETASTGCSLARNWRTAGGIWPFFNVALGGAAPESNGASVGLPRLRGFEDPSRAGT